MQKVFESDAALEPLLFLRRSSISRFRPHYFKAVRWQKVADNLPKYVGEVADDYRVRNIFDPDHHNKRFSIVVVDKLREGLNSLDDETFRNLVLEMDAIDRRCFGPGYRAGKKRSLNPRPELVNHIVVIKKHRTQIEALLDSPIYSGQFILRKHLERVLERGDAYIADIQGSLFHKLMLTTGVMMTAENPTVKHGHVGMKTHAGIFYRFVCQELPDKVARCGLTEAVPQLIMEMTRADIVPETASGFSAEIDSQIKTESRGVCSMTGRMLIGSESFNQYAKHVFMQTDSTATSLRQKLASDPNCFITGSSDHDIPIAKGGKDTKENGQFACIEANSQKGSRSPYGHTTTEKGFLQLLDCEHACLLGLENVTLNDETLKATLDKLDEKCYFPPDLAKMSRDAQVKAIMNKGPNWPMYHKELDEQQKDRELFGRA